MTCKEWAGDWAQALTEMAIRDAILCPYQTSIGGPMFAGLVLLGVINLPIYIRTGGVIIPFVITLVIGGLVITQTASIVQGIIITTILLAIGLGPIVLLRRAT